MRGTLNDNINGADFNQGRKNTLGGIDDRSFRFFRKFLPAVTGDIMFESQMTEFRLIFSTDIDGEAAASLEFATRRWVGR